MGNPKADLGSRGRLSEGDPHDSGPSADSEAGGNKLHTSWVDRTGSRNSAPDGGTSPGDDVRESQSKSGYPALYTDEYPAKPLGSPGSAFEGEVPRGFVHDEAGGSPPISGMLQGVGGLPRLNVPDNEAASKEQLGGGHTTTGSGGN